MFTLYDGRNQLYQWDLNRKIIVEDTKICEVHFCNRTSDCSLVVEPYYIDNVYVADIPNILLQDARPIRAYAYCDDEYTLTEEQFSVKSRTRPADYVYEETEVLQWSTAVEKIDNAIESIPTQVEDTVNQYIAENPIEMNVSIDFLSIPSSEKKATAEQIEFIETALTASKPIYIKTGKEYCSASIEDIGGGHYEIYPCKNPTNMTKDRGGVYNDSAIYYRLVDTTWYIYAKQYKTILATKEYVDNALENVPTGDISITLEDDGEGNVTLVGGTLADGEEVQY